MAPLERPHIARDAARHRLSVRRLSDNNPAMLELVTNRAVHAVTVNFGRAAAISDLHDF